MKVVGIFASKVTRKNRSSPGLASAFPQIHLGCGAAVGSGAAAISSQKFRCVVADALFVVAALVVALVVVALGAGAHVAEATQKKNNSNNAAVGTEKSFLGIRT